MSFKATVALLSFCLDDIFIDVIGVLKSPTIIVLLSVSSLMSVSICFIYLGAPVLGAYVLMSLLSSFVLIPLSLYNALICILL